MKIEQLRKRNILGVIITDNLKWNEHVKTNSSKINKNIGVLIRIRKILDLSTLLLLYHTLILQYLQYCNIVWAAGDSIHIQNLFRRQVNWKKTYMNTSELNIELYQI